MLNLTNVTWQKYIKNSLDAAAFNKSNQHGYYAMDYVLRSPVYNATSLAYDYTNMTDLMLIAINTQSCYTLNFELMRERNDSGAQMKWLEGKLA